MNMVYVVEQQGKAATLEFNNVKLKKVGSDRWELCCSRVRTKKPSQSTGLSDLHYYAKLRWQGWRDSNSQHADLESAALPIGATPLTFILKS